MVGEAFDLREAALEARGQHVAAEQAYRQAIERKRIAFERGPVVRPVLDPP
jgi:hypothetical protein